MLSKARKKAGDIAEGETTVKTLFDPNDIMILKEGYNIKLNGDATVTMADLEAKNGVAHVIDKVLLPPSIAKSEEDSKVDSNEDTEEDSKEATEEDSKEDSNGEVLG